MLWGNQNNKGSCNLHLRDAYLYSSGDRKTMTKSQCYVNKGKEATNMEKMKYFTHDLKATHLKEVDLVSVQNNMHI